MSKVNEINNTSQLHINVIGGGVYLKNKPQNITITWEIKDDSGNRVIPDMLFVNNIKQDPTLTSKTFNRVFSDVDFTVRAVKGDIVAIGTTTARFVGPTQTVENSLDSYSHSTALSANQGRILDNKIENATNRFKGLFLSVEDLSKKFKNGVDGDWAIVGESIPAPIFIWNKNQWEASGGNYDGETVDLTAYSKKQQIAEYTDDYNVSKNHQHSVKVYDDINWSTVKYDKYAPVFRLGNSYDSGEIVNMVNDEAFSYKALNSTNTAPYLTQKMNSFTLEEAISFLPEDLRVSGQKISFYSSEKEAWMTYVFTGGDYTNPTYWEIFTNNIDPDTDKHVAELYDITDELDQHLSTVEDDLNSHITESNNKFDEIDQTLEDHSDRMNDIEDEILMSSVEAACSPKDVEILADRAYKDHTGKIIADEYVTRNNLTNEIIDITNQQVTDLKPGSVDPEDLSEATKQLLGNKNITNLPDEEDITVDENNLLKFKDKEYSPKDYSGMGRKVLRKHYVNGVNTLTQHMINKPNTIYIIQYDYCLADQTIEIPDNCMLQFEGGSFRNGTVVLNNDIISSSYKCFYKSLRLKGTVNNDIIYTNWFENDHVDFYNQFLDIIELSNNSNSYVFFKKDTYVLKSNGSNDCKIKNSIDFNGSTIVLHTNGYEHFYLNIQNSEYKNIDNSKFERFEEAIKNNKSDAEIYKSYKNTFLNITSNDVELMRYHALVDSPLTRSEHIYIDTNGFLYNDLYDYDINIKSITYFDCSKSSYIKNAIILIEDSFNGNQSGGYRNIGINISCSSNITLENIIIPDPNIENYRLRIIYGDSLYNFNINNCNFTNTRSNKDVQINNDTSAYTLSFSKVIRWNMNNVVVGNITGNAWGCTGCNYITDWNINNSSLSRIDVHHRLNNLYVNNTDIGVYGITYSGFGKIVVDNCRIYTKTIFGPRSDYGAYFYGDIYIYNSQFSCNDNDGFIIYSTFTKFNFMPGSERIRNMLKCVGCKNLYIKNIKLSEKQSSIIAHRYYLNEASDYDRDKCISPNIYIDNFNCEDRSAYNILIDYNFRSSDFIDNNYKRKVVFNNCEFKPTILNNCATYQNGSTYDYYLQNINNVLQTEIYYYNCIGCNIGEFGLNTNINIYNSIITKSIYYSFLDGKQRYPTANYNIYNSVINPIDNSLTSTTGKNFPDKGDAFYCYYNCILNYSGDTSNIDKIKTYYAINDRLYPNFTDLTSIRMFDCKFGKELCEMLNLPIGKPIIDYATEFDNREYYVNTSNLELKQLDLEEVILQGKFHIRINNLDKSEFIVLLPDVRKYLGLNITILIENAFGGIKFKYKDEEWGYVITGDISDYLNNTLGLESRHTEFNVNFYYSGATFISKSGTKILSNNAINLFSKINEGTCLYNKDLKKMVVYNGEEWVNVDGTTLS